MSREHESRLGHILVLFFPEIQINVLLIDSERFAGSVTLEAEKIHRSFAIPRRNLKKQLLGVNADMQLEFTGRKRLDRLGANDHPEIRGFDWTESGFPQRCQNLRFAGSIVIGSEVALAVAELQALTVHHNLELAKFAVPLAMSGIEAKFVRETAIIEGAIHGIANVVVAVKCLPARGVGEHALGVAEILTRKHAGRNSWSFVDAIRTVESGPVVAILWIHIACGDDARSIHGINGHVHAIEGLKGQARLEGHEGGGAVGGDDLGDDLQWKSACDPDQILASGNRSDVVGNGLDCGTGGLRTVKRGLVGNLGTGLIHALLKTHPHRIVGQGGHIKDSGMGGIESGQVLRSEMVYSIDESGRVLSKIVEDEELSRECVGGDAVLGL